jgi:excisionase family DNA binding protein
VDESANITLVPPTLPEPTEGAMYTVGEIARFFSVTENSIRRWCADGRLPYAKINGVIRFDREALQAWLDARWHPGDTPSDDE